MDAGLEPAEVDGHAIRFLVIQCGDDAFAGAHASTH